MSSAKASNGERQRKRKRARGDVEMADAEVQTELALALVSAPINMHLPAEAVCCHVTKACAGNDIYRCSVHLQNFLQFLCLVQGTIEESKQEEEEPEVAVPKLDIPDLRQILKRRDEPRATGMFSAAEFIALDDDEAQPQESHEDSHDSAELNGVETVTAMTDTLDEQAPLPADMASGDLA